jgi:hypothetical protein
VAPPKLAFVNSASSDMTNSEVAITQEDTPEGILKKKVLSKRGFHYHIHPIPPSGLRFWFLKRWWFGIVFKEIPPNGSEDQRCSLDT